MSEPTSTPGASSGLLLVRPPSTRLAEGQITHIAPPTSIDYATAQREWEAYVSAFRSEGWTVVAVPQAEDCPDSVFIEDAVVMFGHVAVLASPGTVSRENEVAAVRQTLESHAALKGKVTVRAIERPGTLDGGDVLKVGNEVYVGRGGRTNGEGIRQLRRIVTPLGYRVHPVPVSKALHLKSAVTALPDGTVIGYEPIIDDTRIFPRFMPIPEEHGVAVVVLSSSQVLMSSDAPQTRALIESLGYEVVTVPIGQFEQLEGCVTCLSVRVRGIETR